MTFRNIQLYTEAKTVQAEYVVIVISGNCKLENGLLCRDSVKSNNRSRFEKLSIRFKMVIQEGTNKCWDLSLTFVQYQEVLLPC